ncbi:hypothetical protein [Variovorax sp. dw_308]|uniref:hypothetical protein n=1 Tax=Variovorax sp. dw_308 TaxID=2721546 RepID=UPI001C44FEAE|nr:hypothetical protein [Variovorax sp. dw_308]
MATSTKTFQFDRTVVVVTTNTDGSGSITYNPPRANGTRYNDGHLVLDDADRMRLCANVRAMLQEVGDTNGLASHDATYGLPGSARSKFFPDDEKALAIAAGQPTNS